VLQQAIARRMITFDELAAKIGHRPHPDKLGGVVKMSTNYKSLGAAMSALQAATDSIEQKSLKDIGVENVQELENKLSQVIAASVAYKVQHRGEQDKVEAVNLVIADANQYKDMLTAVNWDAAHLYFGGKSLPANITLAQAFDLKRRGINFADCEFETYNDDNLDKENSKEKLGSGAVNTVAKLVHIGDRTPRVFKPEPEIDRNQMTAAKTIGIDATAPHFGNRNIASRAVCDFIGANVIPKACYAMHKGEVGLLMDFAPGEMAGTEVMKKANVDTDDFKKLLKDPAKLQAAGFKQNEDGEWMHRDEIIPGVTWRQKPSPAAEASLHQQLNALEWCDILTGQMDRHPLNYFVAIRDNQAVVTGIDNDFAFGEKETVPPFEFRGCGAQAGFGGIGNMPKLIDRQTFDRLQAANFDKHLKPRLDGLLSAAEIDASRARFDCVRKHAVGLAANKCVVDDWGTWRSAEGKTATQFLSEADVSYRYHRPKQSLFGRDFSDCFPKPSERAA